MWDGEEIQVGDTFSANHPVARAFPSLFEPADQETPPRRPQVQVVSRDEVVAARTRLLAAGRPAGYESLARELSVSRETVRRRLASGAV
jgi:hypothetical protein